jgi:hypothetical protein
MAKNTSRQCVECDFYYIPGKTDCYCGASMFPPLDPELSGTADWANYLTETGRIYQ